MGSETWFVQIEVIGGMIEGQLPTWYKGPVIRIGRDPGPDGITLHQFRGVAAHHATITAYDGTNVQLTSVGSHVVRVASHMNEEWEQVQPINGNVYLNDGDVIHLGSLNRGCRLRFITCKPLEWRQSRLVAVNENEENELLHNDFQPIQVSTMQGRPKWFVPSLLLTSVMFFSFIGAMIIDHLRDPIATFGPKETAYDHYQTIDINKEIPKPILDGYKEPFREFVMAPNAERADMDDLADDFELWDKAFYTATINTLQVISNSRGFWADLERAKEDYALVVRTMQQLDLPTVFSAIPYQETRYRKKLTSYVCAGGIWQFMPETAKRTGLSVRDCKIKGVSKRWTPTSLAPPLRISRDAVYYNSDTESCKIESCLEDDRFEVTASTVAAGELLQESWLDPELTASGSAVQMTILAHNAGFDDSKFLGKEKSSNILPAYRRYMKRDKKTVGVTFYGDSIKCDPKEKNPHNPQETNASCGSVIVNQTQHYGYKVVAQHLLAVCYYAKNYGNQLEFRDWKKKYVVEGGYCNLINQGNP